MNIKNNNYLWFGISTAIIISLIYFADTSKLAKSVTEADFLLLIPALSLGLAVFPLWSYIWYRVFKKSGINVPYPKSIRIFMAGNFMNAITPLGHAGGEPLMAYLLEQNSTANYEKSLSSIFSADIINLTPTITYLLGATAYLSIFGTINQIVLQGLYIGILTAIFGGGAVYLLWFESGTIEAKIFYLGEKISEKTDRGDYILESLEEKLEKVEKNFETIGENPSYLLKTALVSHTVILFQVFKFYFIMLSLGFKLDMAPIFFVVVLSSIANWTPTPGGAGTYEATMAALATAFFPISFETGITAAMIVRLTTHWPGMLIGWLSLNSLKGEVKR